MKIAKGLFICCALASGFLSSLKCIPQVNLNDPKVIKQQTEDAIACVAMFDPWSEAIKKYSAENIIDLKIKCKDCGERVLTLGEFDGSLLAWLIKAIADGHEAFEKVKTLTEEYIKLLSGSTSSEEIINFMLKTSNDMKQVCANCHGAVWEKKE